MDRDLGTHYQVLGVQPTASAEDIRTAFRRLAKSLHPDHNKLPGAREKFQEVKQAYDVLVDTSSRTDYDRELKIQAMAAAAAAAQAAAGGRRASTLSFRRSRAAGSSKAQAAARPASGDDFDAFTAGNTSPNGSSSPGSNSGVVGSSSYNSIFNETRRSVSRSRSASRSRSPGYRSVFDGLPRAATPSAAGMPATASPSPQPPRPSVTPQVSYARASGSSQQPPGTLTLQTCSTPAHTDDGSSAPLTSSAALQPPPPSPPKGIQAYGVISTAPPSPSGLPPSSPSVAAAAPVSSPSSSSSGPAPSSPLGSSIGDVASKLVALAAATAPAPRSGSGGSSSGGYISIFGGAANYTAVAVGGRAASPEKTSSSSTGTSSSNNIGRGSSGGSSTGGMLAEAAPAPSAAFQVTVSPKAVKDTAAKFHGMRTVVVLSSRKSLIIPLRLAWSSECACGECTSLVL
ncbi:molecular chaperone [Volvox carteri f. nagariensis]|uniref:Molecular chaperone n=1 Tax=Volvox carteri f. nagariensis TaxID=3068 RepID=D8TMN0_VOLCA|nr:molecular chaperone [Volvox carteri f. nagariensis]EFJ51152.1 molecular chaperone [Volvox carteri f. nagariensis]|eukprot:XP_002947619.1 molecular chaperone [Volvox carteri f. nagariensis]